jgi:hypothetical protein
VLHHHPIGYNPIIPATNVLSHIMKNVPGIHLSSTTRTILLGLVNLV